MGFLVILLTPELLKEGEDAAPGPQQVFLQWEQQLRSPKMRLQHRGAPILRPNGNLFRDGVHQLHVLQVEIAFSHRLGREGERGQYARPIRPWRLSKTESAEGDRPRVVVGVRAEDANATSRASQEGAQLCCRHVHDGWREDQGELEARQVDHVGNGYINGEGSYAEVGCLLRRVNPDNSD